MITTSPAFVLAKYLTDGGYCNLIWPPGGDPALVPSAFFGVSVSAMPDKGGNFVSFYDTTPMKDGRYIGTGENILHYGIMLRVRSKDYNKGWKQCGSLINTLQSIVRQSITIESTVYLIQAIRLSSGPISLGTEKDNREIFSINLFATITDQ